MENETEFQQLLDSTDPFRARLLTTLQRIHTDGVVVTFLKNELYVQWLKSFDGYFADDAQLDDESDQHTDSSSDKSISESDDSEQYGYTNDDYQDLMSQKMFSSSDDDDTESTGTSGHEDSSSGFSEPEPEDGHEEENLDDNSDDDEDFDDFFAHWVPYPAGEIEITHSNFRIAFMELEMVSFYLSSLN